VEDDGGVAFHALQLVRGADEQVWQVGQHGADGGGLADVCADHSHVFGGERAGTVCGAKGVGEQVAGAVGAGGDECCVSAA
jgi:hypothetical protein